MKYKPSGTPIEHPAAKEQYLRFLSFIEPATWKEMENQLGEESMHKLRETMRQSFYAGWWCGYTYSRQNP